MVVISPGPARHAVTRGGATIFDRLKCLTSGLKFTESLLVGAAPGSPAAPVKGPRPCGFGLKLGTKTGTAST